LENLANITLFILQGAVITLKIYFVTIIFSIPLGMLCAMGKLTKIPPLRWILGVYTWVFRGTPLLLQLLFVYFGLPYLGLELSREMAAYVTFVINYAAYFTEIFRAGIQSIDRGQYEAAKALVGRNNKENDMLTFKIASGKDIWFHTKDIPGSHVILITEGKSITETAIFEAASLAAYHSKGRESENVPVDYTQVRYVKKPTRAKPGMVIFTNNKTIYVNPQNSI
jgi:His/Glu/Gln/Arg/opine family amino acid ABC transporter permease subunit